MKPVKRNEFNDRVKSLTNPATLVALLAHRAAAEPQRIAYSFLADGEAGQTELTWKQLDRKARGIAALLQRSGATGERVLLLYPPGLEYIEAFFGCLYAGAVAVPAYPPRLNYSLLRLQAIVSDCDVRFALTSQSANRRIMSLVAPMPDLSALQWHTTSHLPEGMGDDWQTPPVSSDTLAFLQYTSGSTGTPKGVMLTHGNLLANSALLAEAFEYGPDSVCVSWLPAYHDMGLIGGVIQPLYGGFSCLLLSPVSFLHRPLRWLKAISDFKATISGAPNFAYELCVNKIKPDECASLDLSSWEVAFNGSEPVRRQTLERFADAFKTCGFRRQAFYPCYGLAEATLFVSGGRKGSEPIVKLAQARGLEKNEVISADDDAAVVAVVSCGRLRLSQQVRIVNPESLKECAANEIGEIWLAGPSIAQGYWNQPAETKQTFAAHLSDTEEGPFLRTGDLGFINDGELFVTGRLKDLIIIRGLNHYPQDLELTAQASHAGLRAGCCAAFSLEVEGQERLVVVQEVDHANPPDPNEAINAIREGIVLDHELQPYAVLLVKQGSVPKTSSGKIQRFACRTKFLENSLPVICAWQQDGSPPSRMDAPALLREPEDVSQIMNWLVIRLSSQQGMHPNKIDINQPITRYGLDSLAIIELIHSIESSLSVSLPMHFLLQSPSVARIAAEIIGQRVTANFDDATIALPIEESTDKYNLSVGQKALWYLHQLAPQAPTYNIAAAARITSPVNIDALRDAVETLVERHPSLRTTIRIVDDEPVQRVNASMTDVFKVHHVSSRDEQSLQRELSQEAQRPFDLEHGPLLRIGLFTGDDYQHTLLIVAHHIAADFWSLAVLAHEMGRLYDAANSGAAPALDPLKASYADYFHWQANMLKSPRRDLLWDYWQNQLAGELPSLNMPTDRARPPVQTFNGRSHGFNLTAELTQQLKEFSRERDTTLYTSLTAAFQLLLHRYTGQKEAVIGSLVAGRMRADFAGVVGYFVNPIALRADFSGDTSFEIFLSRVRHTLLEAIEHGDYPFPLLVEKLQPARDPSRSPLFQTMFIFQKAHLADEAALASFALGENGAAVQIGGLSLESLALEQRAAQFDLTLIMAETNGQLRGSIEYNTDLFDVSSIERLASHFTNLLRSVILHAAEPLSEQALLSVPEQIQILEEWNDTARDYAPACIHHMFEEQVERTPHAIALVCGSDALTYLELNRRANQLANFLRQMEVGPENLVGICTSRSIEMIIGLLAIMKAGAAYVPLDPAYPRERLALVLDDARVCALLTQENLTELLPPGAAQVICIDGMWPTLSGLSDENPRTAVTVDNLAYVIYTSGSTGKPKGVMLTHRCVSNFFAGMDQKIGCDSQDTMLAVTSISFDISVLELFWTLTRGVKVVLQAEQATGSVVTSPERRRSKTRPMQFSLFYFASSDAAAGEDKYRLLIEGAKYADQNGFEAVWTPERHFHEFGGLYPNPSVMSAALAMVTSRVKLRAGSVVLPLHHPIRIAEEWALVDNLSQGRAAIAFASGWHSDDFAFFPDNYAERKEAMFKGIETVKQLWRGEAITVRGGAGNDIQVRIFPKPRQDELPVWITAAGANDTFIRAGEIGANVLTHLLGQTVTDVAGKINLYREALARSGHDPLAGKVTLMLHTFIGDDKDKVRELVREPFTAYLKSSVGLITNLIKSMNLPLDMNTLSANDMDDLLGFAFDRYFETSALFGTPETCVAMIDNLKEIGVDEVACLIDFGLNTDLALAGLEQIKKLKHLANTQAEPSVYAPAAQPDECMPSLMQCTPSMMRMQMLIPESMEALKPLQTLMLGGEALPGSLAAQVKAMLPCRLVNMYGPTETTIWSATHEVNEITEVVSIGKPIANTQLHILDRFLNPVPPGVTGELYIGGHGLARGYLDRPDLTAEKFTPNPFSREPGARMYNTGDTASYYSDGTVKFLGRADQQVKIRGHRIELEEIEFVLSQHESVKEAVVVAHENAEGDKRLVAHLVTNGEPPSSRALRAFVRQKLPEYMVPAIFVMADRLPLTANGKVDRKALRLPEKLLPDSKTEPLAPRSKIERIIAEVWQQVLGLDRVGVHDNFFDLGGHSLLMVQAHSMLREKFNADFPLIKLLEFPTISALAKLLGEKPGNEAPSVEQEQRANRQKEWLQRQRPNARRATTNRD
jgi:natural product biosynthesis luciferase-like monooxygenase protein